MGKFNITCDNIGMIGDNNIDFRKLNNVIKVLKKMVNEKNVDIGLLAMCVDNLENLKKNK